MRNINRLALVGSMASAILLGACSSTPVAPPPVATAPASAPKAQPAAAPSAAPQVATPAPVSKAELAAYLDPANPLSNDKSVFFDFDQYMVKPEGQRVLEMHGKYLAAHSAVKIRVEGNADEQGGAEYNLALGQKRADAVVKVLKVFGVKDTQMEAVSFGKEKPKALGHDEQSRAQNRRVDLDYPNK
ncbi:peptidoglycan-associated lipoprotein Pal [Rhodoferax lacus]|uniref:Peptidoglycan-associated lipoprotein n=1 Tax=Rhodoferax lacus TaxID=2184758 RepID=A0A3E1RAK7_9BURK|nr:peptidoglycan-associated lipoprotein Pal [Rhodoferax lacus]RFO96395.1 peptidoglycan-associated lipoprotein Pal [Rhodoferax lacus]